MESGSISLSVDPADRGRAFVTSCGGQASFINDGDMYAMALEYAVHITNGALTYIRADGTEAPAVKDWNPQQWLADNRKVL